MYRMGRRGPKPGTVSKNKLSQQWRPELAYAVGLLAADGCLASTGYLIDFTSKDKEQVVNFARCLGLYSKIGTKGSGYSKNKCYRIQFKSILFYKFLVSVGLTPAKSKTLGALKIPRRYFFDFLRGSLDGDGCTYSYWDPRWRSSFMYYLCFVSASKKHVEWIRRTANTYVGVQGHVTSSRSSSLYHLKYAKAEAKKLMQLIYKDKNAVYLSRKKLKIDKALSIVGERL